MHILLLNTEIYILIFVKLYKSQQWSDWVLKYYVLSIIGVIFDVSGSVYEFLKWINDYVQKYNI